MFKLISNLFKEPKAKIDKKILNPNYNVPMRNKTPETEIDFVSLTAHQLRKPLSEMKLSLEMLLSGDFGAINKEQKDIIEKVLQRNKILIFLVKDLLDLAKIEEKCYSFNLTLVNVQDLIEFIINSTKEEIKKKKIKFTFKKPNIRPLEIMLDKEKMCLAIQNIIDNAVKYTPAKGSITVSLNVQPKELEFKIQDSGIGIPENQKKKLFTKFFRADNAIKMELVGSGLGLLIAKNIIEAHNGRISFISEENKGTTFTVVIPIR